MKLSKLTRLDKDELLKEIEELTLAIAEYNKILGDESYRNICLKKKIADMKSKYGDERRTKIIQMAEEPKEKKDAPVVEPEKCVVIMNNNGALKRIPVTAFRTQKTNTKGIKTQDDITSAVIRTNTVDSLLVFTNKGNMYRIAVNDIPEGTNTSKGTPMEQLVAMQPEERTAVIYSLYKGSTDKYVVFVTKNGIVKKTAIEEYSQTRKKTGLAAIALMDTDELASVFLASDEDVILVSELGMMIRFPLAEIACQGRVTRGVKGITLNPGDAVLTALPVRNTNDDLAIFTHEGLGKRIVLNEIPTQRRAGKGLQAYKLPKDSSNWISAATMVADVDQLLVMGKSNSLCITGESIPVIGRTGLGNIIIKDNNILSVSKI
jgi:DNA gyrase subunit A